MARQIKQDRRGAPDGNKNAQKWTFEKSDELLDKCIEACDDKETYLVSGKQIEGYKYDFIGEIARNHKVFHQLITREIPKHHPSLKEKVDQLKTLLESNCYSNTKKGIINTAVGIVNLKSNHGWTDRVDSTTKGEEIKTHSPIDLSKLSDDTIDAIIADMSNDQ